MTPAGLPAAPHSDAMDVSASALDQLVVLAASRTIDDRRRLLLGIAGLYEASAAKGAPKQLTEIFLTLARQAEEDIRKALSVRLAEADWAPAALVLELALDKIEIARPVIASSPLLADDDLIRVMVEATIEHQIAVARRPNLGSKVSGAIVQRAEPAVVSALAGNRTAQLAPWDIQELVDQSRRIAALRAPLSRHPALNENLALQLYQWVGQSLKQTIAERFSLDETALTQALDGAIRAAASTGASGPQMLWGQDTEADRQEADARLVAKLKAAGKLNPGFLVRAVREKRLDLFRMALAALGEFELAQVERALRSDNARSLYFACVAVGVDRAAFASLLADIQGLNQGFPGSDGGAFWKTSICSPSAALHEFRLTMQAQRR